MSRKKYKGPYYGPFFFNISKPVGITSFDVIRKLKRLMPFTIGKIGHFGTLDPFADGVMLIGIGQAPRLNIWTQNLTKEYIAKGVFGIGSATGDNTAEVDDYVIDSTFDSIKISDTDIREQLNSFLGDYLQKPHSYSATKHEGKALHEWAREGVIIEKPPVKRFIHEVELIDVADNICTFRVVVSSGTYIRVLFEDLAKRLGTLGHLQELTRSKIGHHKIEDSYDFSLFEKDFVRDDFLKEYAKSAHALVLFDDLELSDDECQLYANGVKIISSKQMGTYWIRSSSGGILGLGEVTGGVIVSHVNFSPAASVNIDLSLGNSLD